MVIEITRLQYEALGRSSFSLRMLDTIRQMDPDGAATLSETATLTEMERQITKANDYGFVDERGIAVYIMTAWLLGTEFDRQIPAAAQILDAPDLPPATKARALEDLTLSLFAALDTPDAPTAGGHA